MKEEELKIQHGSHIAIYRYGNKHEEQQTINTKVIMEFDNLAYVFGPLSQWVRLSYFCSKLQMYIIKVPMDYKNELIVFF
jgi:hypothetical protein